MPQIIWDTAETGLCYYGNAFTYCNPHHVVIALAILIAVFSIVVWIGIHYTGGVVE